MSMPTTTTRRSLPTLRSIALLLATLAAACSGDAGHHDDAPQDEAPPPSNRIDVPPAVRRNLGIEFTPVTRRHVRETLRLPGQIELLPTATRQYHAPFAGRVQLHVQHLQPVATGDLLYTIDSHEWRDRQQQLAATESALVIAETQLASMRLVLEACERHETSLREARDVTTSYIATLQDAEREVGGQAQKIAVARVELAQIGAQLADASEKHTETNTRIQELETQIATTSSRLRLQLAGAAASLGVPVEALRDDDTGWRDLALVEVRAQSDGVVDVVAIASGDLVQANGDVLHTIDPRLVRCRAQALQSDAVALQDSMPATLTAATARVTGVDAAATVQLAPTGDPRARTVDVFATPTTEAVEQQLGRALLRPGTAVFVEVDTSQRDAPATPPLAIPSAAVLPDGLDRVFFRRDPKAPDRVIRVVADLGYDDGRWVEVRSGLMDGDEVVLAGAFELVLASSGQAPKGGHFHADGTFHEDH